MALKYDNLDPATRTAMAAEIDRDAAGGSLYISPRLNDRGVLEWPELLRASAASGTDDWLAEELSARGLLKTQEESQRNGRPYSRAVPVNAATTLAEGEFNRFYLRGIALRGSDEGRAVEIYRGRTSLNPRQESEALLGEHLDANDLLADLRMHIGVDSALGLPPGPNSGLTGRLV